jgi:hypothetical protein
MRHPPACPQAGSIAQSFRPALQPPLDAPQIFRTQVRFPSGAPRLLQRSHSTLLELLIPAADRLPVYAHLTGDLGLWNSLAQQFRRLKTTPF